MAAFPPPTKVEDIRPYMGLINFVRGHVSNLASIAKPISDLLRKNVLFVWTPDCQSAFEQIRKAIINILDTVAINSVSFF